MRGNKPKPTRLHVLNGNPSKINIDERIAKEPKPRPIAPACPKKLSKEAKAEWRKIAPKLERLGLLTEIDGEALSFLCEELAKYFSLSKEIRESGYITKAPSGYPIVNPLVSIANKAFKNAKDMMIEFGMTPASRSRIEVAKISETDDPMEKLLKEGK